MFKILFEWWDRHPDFYWVAVIGPTAWLLWWAIAPSLRRTEKPEPRLLPAGLFLLILLVWRWPWLFCAFQFSPDESQHIAGMLTLAVDPVFFRSLDGSTAGPLNFYLPLPLVLALGHIDFFTVRLAGLLMVWGSLLLVYRAAVLAGNVITARLGLLPALLFFATTNDQDFLHYSTEHVPVFLLCVTLWLLVRAWASVHSDRWLLAAGLVAGLTPWAKLQIGPVSAGLVCCGLWQVATAARPAATRARHALILSFSTFVPTALGVGLLAAGGLLQIGIERYLTQNFSYVEEGASNFQTIRALWTFTWDSGSFPAFAVGPLVMIGLAGATTLWQRHRCSAAYAAGAGLTTLAVICVLLPGRPFRHYLLLLIVPLTLWGLAALAELWTAAGKPRRLMLAGVAFVLGGLLPLGQRLMQPVPFMFGSLAEHWRHPRGEAANVIHFLTRPDDRLALWGYAPEIYAESGLAQGTRDSYTYWSIQASPHREAYRTIYLADLERNRPALFVDAVGPGSIYYRERTLQGHETFPLLARFIATHYTEVIDLGQFRIYLRNDTLAVRRPTLAGIQAAVQRGRGEFTAAPAPASTVPINARHEKIGRQWAQLLLPPAALSWNLTGTEREVRLDYGFHPKALAAHAGNGALLVVEIVTPGRPVQPVYRHFVEPLVHPAERQPLAARFPLPPFPPGAHLVIRTEAGPFNDDAWDWLYVADVQFRRSPFPLLSQFPGFNRAPATVAAGTAYFVESPGHQLLMEHAPVRLSFPLTGREQRLAFAFGFNPGAYEGEGHTNGAIFRVERMRTGQPAVTLYERRLDPSAQSTDRGRQSGVVNLNGIEAEDSLTVTIDPAGSDAWDWTYITDFDLH